MLPGAGALPLGDDGVGARDLARLQGMSRTNAKADSGDSAVAFESSPSWTAFLRKDSSMILR